MRFIRLVAFTLLVASTSVLVGCKKDNPGLWPVEKIEAKLVERFELTEISLTPTEGGFTGEGKTSEGETLKLEIKQFPDDSKFTWDAQGDRGLFEDGFYELK